MALAAGLAALLASGAERDSHPPQESETAAAIVARPGVEQVEPLGGKLYPPRYDTLDYRLNQLVARAEGRDAAPGTPAMDAGSFINVVVRLDPAYVHEVAAYLREQGAGLAAPRPGAESLAAAVPLSALADLAARPGVHLVMAEPSIQRYDAGVAPHGADFWQDPGWDGGNGNDDDDTNDAGNVKIGIIDGGILGYGNGLTAGRVADPKGVHCFLGSDGTTTDSIGTCEFLQALSGSVDQHGTFVAQLLYDIAPGADYYLARIVRASHFEAAITWLIAQDVDVISTSLGKTWEGPGDGTSPYMNAWISQVGRAVDAGIFVAVASGNFDTSSWFGTFRDSDGDDIMDWDETGDECNEVQFDSSIKYNIRVRWEDTWNGANDDLDIYLRRGLSQGTSDYMSENVQNGAPQQDPFENIGLEPESSVTYCLVIVRESGVTPEWVQVLIEANGPDGPSMEHWTRGYSLGSPAETTKAGAVTVGAAPVTDTSTIQSTSGRGPLPASSASTVVKPDVVGVDEVPVVTISGTFNIDGTSIATPHVAGLAALVKQRNPDYTPAQIATYLRDNALPRGETAPNNTWGYGLAFLPHIGPAITGKPQLGVTLTANTAGVDDIDGMPASPTFTYQWIRVSSGGTEANISGATSATYTPVQADVGKTLKVQVSFQDDATTANDEEQTSRASLKVVPANRAATGKPTISGTLRVTETVTASTSPIRDVDGLTGATFEYQWVRVDGGTDTDIPGETESSYVLQTADQDKQVKVKVSFTDNNGNAETVVSDASAVVGSAPNRPPQFSAATASREVAENTAAGVDIGAPVVATDSSGTVTYTLGGTDAASFDIDAATGQLETRAALDYETRSSYEVTVTATDSGGTTDIAVTINVINVIELTAITGPTSASFGESGWGRVATFTASSDQDRDGVNWTLSGDDAGHFSIDSAAGALRFDIDPVAPNLFRQPPDFENPLDADRVNSYQVTVVASVGANSSAPISLTVTVIDEDENGQLTLSTTKPQVGQALTASLSDPDSVSGTVVWTWERSAGRNRWVTIDGATHSSYAPVAADSGEYLRITATYGDGHGTGKSVSKALHNVVIADRLASLSVTTNDSTGAASWRQIRPAFDAETLHYSIGCGDSDSMSLTFAAADAQSRLSVDGAAYGNPGAEQSLTAAVSVGGQSDATISLSNATGGETQYVVHCMADDLGEFTSVKSTGATEELFLVPRDSYLLILDNNAVPRYRRHLVDHEAQTYFRFYPNGGNGEYRYSYSVAHNRGHVILDENLEEIGRASTILPVTSNDSHDFRVLDNGNYLLMTYQPGIRDFSFLTFLDSNGEPFGTDVSVSESWIQIVKPTNTALLSWNSWDHMPLEDCTHHWFPPALGRWAHVNSIEMTGGEIVASFRGCNRILGIDPSTGKVNWRIGPTNLSDAEWASSGKGPAPMDIVGDPQIQFCGQHAASILPNGNLLLYDNGANCSRNPWTGENLVRPDRTYGRAVEYYLDFEHDEVVYVREHSLNGTKNYIGWVGGNVSALENGDWLISWGVDRLAGNAPIPDGPPFSVNVDVTQVDPATGEEVLSLDWNPDAQEGRRVTAMPAYALARQPRSLVATFPGSSTTSMLHSGATDRPQIVVTFNHPIADFDQTSPSLRIQAATVESIRSHVVNGESANTYVITLVPDGDRTITVRLLPNHACSLKGICLADGTMLSEVPDALVIEPPVITLASAAGGAVTVSGSAVSVEENHTGDLVNVTATDPESTHTDYTLALGGTHSTSFTLSSTGGAGVLSFTNPPDHEVREVYRLTLTASNASESSTRDVTVTVRDVNEPADISFVATGGVTVNDNALTVDENHDGTLATFRARDPENDQTLTYTWSTDPPDHFVIRAGVLSFKNIPDYELPAGGTTSYDIAVSALDSGGMTGSIAVTVTVTNVDEPPEITLASAAGSDVTVSGSAVSVDENHTGDLVNVTATDPESTHTDYTLALGGTHSTSFTLSSTGGAGVLSFTNPPDHEVREVYRLTLTASNASESSTRDVTVTVRDVNEPADISFVATGGVTVNDNALTVDENHDGTLATFRARDPENDQTLTYTWSTDPPDHFVIRAGVLSFKNIPDYELPAGGTTSYDIAVSALDSGGMTGSIAVTVTVTNVDEPPEITLASAAGSDVTVSGSAVSVDENHTGDLVNVTATDPESTHTDYTLALGGTHSTSFTLNSTGGAGVLSFTNPPDHEVREVYRLTLTASNASESSTLDVTVTVRDVNEPADISFVATGGVTVNDNALTVDENHDGTLATFRARDPENDQTLTYTWSTDPPDHFVIRAGVLSFKNIPDYELPAGGTTSYDIAVSALDSGGMTGSIAVTVTVTNVDEPPEITLASAAGSDVTVSGSAVSVDENHTGDLVNVTATDPESTHTDYTLALGGTHSTSFTLNTGVLSFTNPPDHEARVVYDLTLTASNAMESSTLNVTVTVRDVNDPPTISGETEVSLNEVVNPTTGQVVRVGAYRKSDPDRRPPQTTNWGPVGSSQVLSGADRDTFEFDQLTGMLTFASPPDYENGGGRYRVTLTANDGADPGTLDVTVNVANVEEAGMLTLGAQRGVNGEALVATLTDPDNVVSETWQWQHSMSRSGPWTDIANTDSNSYTPGADDVGNYLRASVTHTDGTGPDETTLTADTEFPTDNDASTNEPPTPPDPLPQVADVPENAPAGRNVVQVVFTDPESEQLTYSVDLDEFEINSSGQITVKPGAAFDHETKPTLLVTVRAADPIGAFATATLMIPISDVNEPPTAADLAVTILEDEDVDIDVVGRASDEDAGDTLTVARVERHPEAGTVAVDDGTNDITYEPNDNYHGADSFTYQVKDGAGLSSNIATVAITIDPVNDAPEFPATTTTRTRSVSERAQHRDPVGAPVTAVDVDGDDLTYSLAGSTSFEMLDGTAQITVREGAVLNATNEPTHMVTVTVADEYGATASIVMTITVTAGPVVSPPGGGGGGSFGGGGGGGGPTGPTPSQADFEWSVSRDIEELDGGHDKPSGTWSDGATLWVLENGDGADDAIYAYDLESGERLEGREFKLDETNRAPRGVWSDRTVLWVSDSGRNRLFAHNLASGERLPERDIALAERNRAARGIWSDEESMWVLDGRSDALFAYDLGSGVLLGEYPLHSANDDAHGIWSDRVTIWVSNHDPKRLFAYRLPPRPDEQIATAGDEEGAGEKVALVRVSGEEFDLRGSGNNSPRGLWSDGDVMYVADENDNKVYTYNMPDAIDARLASLALSGVPFGEFDSAVDEYAGILDNGVAETTVVAEAVQDGAMVSIAPSDADGDIGNGHQVSVESDTAITVTVASADRSRTRVYRVAVDVPVEVLQLTPTWNSLEWPGVDGVAVGGVLEDGGIADKIAVIYEWDGVGKTWRVFFPGLEDVPGLNTLAVFRQGHSYWIAVAEPITWTVAAGAGDAP